MFKVTRKEIVNAITEGRVLNIAEEFTPREWANYLLKHQSWARIASSIGSFGHSGAVYMVQELNEYGHIETYYWGITDKANCFYGYIY